MKLENEHARGVQTPPRKSYNPFDSDDEDTDTYSKSSNNGYDIKTFEATSNSLTFHLDGQDLSWEEAIIEQSQMLKNSIASDLNTEEVIYRKDTEFFTDKTITECKVPKLVLPYKDNGFKSVKDIGIDEGVTNHDKVWIKTEKSRPNNEVENDLAGQAQLKGRRSWPNNDVEKDLGGQAQLKGPRPRPVNDVEKDLAGLAQLEGPKSRPKNDVEKDLAAQARSEGPVYENGLEYEVLGKPYSDEECETDLLKVDVFEHDLSSKENDFNSSLKGTDLIEGADVANSKKDCKINDKYEEDYHKVEKTINGVSKEKYCHGNVPLLDSEKYLAKPSIEQELQAKIDSNENQSDEIASIQPLDLANTSSYNSSVNSRSIILEFSSSSKVSGKEEEENPQEDETVKKPLESQSKSRDDGIAPGPSILYSGMENRVYGETSFSASMPLPASITYVGPSAHNGSVSLRSESSAGSTRSFAFPVLQTEWNSSPVRMAKADRRHFRKQRGWVHSLICCKY